MLSDLIDAYHAISGKNFVDAVARTVTKYPQAYPKSDRLLGE
jgi:hypothetical protein